MKESERPSVYVYKIDVIQNNCDMGTRQECLVGTTGVQ